MHLADWLKAKELKPSHFAAQIGVSPQAISGWCDGTFWITKENAKKIYDATGGEVTPTDFMLIEPESAA